MSNTCQRQSSAAAAAATSSPFSSSIFAKSICQKLRQTKSKLVGVRRWNLVIGPIFRFLSKRCSFRSNKSMNEFCKHFSCPGSISKSKLLESFEFRIIKRRIGKKKTWFETEVCLIVAVVGRFDLIYIESHLIFRIFVENSRIRFAGGMIKRRFVPYKWFANCGRVKLFWKKVLAWNPEFSKWYWKFHSFANFCLD